MTVIVTPFVGVWIETKNPALGAFKVESHPSWVCGLKLNSYYRSQEVLCHTLRGCVD